MSAADDQSKETSIARVEPAGVEVAVRRQETLFDAAWRLHLDWPTICFGQAQCTFCHVRIRAGQENAVPMLADGEEPVMVRRVSGRLYGGDMSDVRLACRLFLRGDVVVEQTVFTGKPRD